MKRKFISINQKIIGMLLIVIILPTMLLGFTNYQKSSGLLEQMFRDTASETLKGMDTNINTFMRGQEESLSVLSMNANVRDIKNKVPADFKYVDDVFNTFLSGHSDITNVYIGGADKVMNIYPTQELPKGYDPTSRPWYQNAIAANGLVWSDPYEDASTKAMIVSLSMPVYDYDNNFIGVLAVDISLDKMSAIVNGTKIGNQGYLALYDKQGIAIAHPDSKLVGQELPVQELKEAAYAKESGNINYVFNDVKKCAYFTTIGDAGWKLLGIFNYSEIKNKTKSIWINAIIMGAITLLVALFIGFFISSPIIKNIKTLVKNMERVGAGDLTIRSDIKSKDELGILGQTFNKMVEDQQKAVEHQTQLIETNNKIFYEVSQAADQVEIASSQIAAGSQSLAQSTTEQASIVEEVNASMEEIASQSKDNAQNSNKARDLVISANESAMQGSIKMKEMTGSMNEINEASGNISKIIKVIDDIAFQTNILALNAAVEAARAGVHGKGFAVVAEEVRNLAARSSEAAKETTALIEGTINKTEKGTAIAKDTNEALNKITEKISEVASTIETISNASTQQAAAIGQIQQAVSQVADTTQTNSATAEQSAASSIALSNQASILKVSMSRFDLNTGKNKQTHTEGRPTIVLEESNNHIGNSLSDGYFGKY